MTIKAVSNNLWHKILQTFQIKHTNRYLPRSWLAIAFIIGVLIAIPVLTIINTLWQPSYDTWSHLIDTVFKDYIRNSLILMLGVGCLALITGITTAWLTSMCNFPGKGYFQWVLLLPMAMPAYIIAFTYTGMLDAAGPLQNFIRDSFNLSYGEYWFPDIRSLPGAILMLSLVLYPYVYMLTRAALLEQSVCVLEVSRTLGCGPWRCLVRVAIPLARPAIVVGLTLVSMETLADYGTVEYFGISTFTTGIFRTWFGLNDLNAAAQLSAVLLSFILVLIAIERVTRKQQRFHHTSNKYSNLPSYQLTGVNALGAFVICLLPVLFGFIIPAAQLCLWAIKTLSNNVDTNFMSLAFNSLWLASITALIATAVALFLVYTQRMQHSKLLKAVVTTTGLGYAIPGTVIAVGVIIPFTYADNILDQWLRNQFNISSGLLLSGTILILIFAYLVRFLSVSIQTVDAAYRKIKPSIDDAARTLNTTPAHILAKVHFPIMRGSLLTAALLVFVDVLKELPATLVLRPFDFNTLAVRAYELASNERLSDASVSALGIVAVGLIPVILLSYSINRSRPGSQS